MSDNITPQAWGAPLVQEVSQAPSPTTGLVSPIKVLTLVEPNKSYAQVSAASKLKAVVKKIEEDISYFSALKGSALLTNKLGVIKFDLNEILEQLER